MYFFINVCDPQGTFNGSDGLSQESGGSGQTKSSTEQSKPVANSGQSFQIKPNKQRAKKKRIGCILL